MVTMTSPTASPALAPGPSWSRARTYNPGCTPTCDAIAAVMGTVEMPVAGGVNRPLAINWSATTVANAVGMAKPIPTLPPPASPLALGTVAIAVLTPTSAPVQSTRAPPELPGLIEASVCRPPGIRAVSPPSAGTTMSRPSALMMPAVTEPSNPSGAPSATTGCPTSNPSESPSVITGSGSVVSTFRTARSNCGERPVIVACLLVPSLNRMSMRPPPAPDAMTWSLVRMYPESLSTSPLPLPLPWAPRTPMVTTEGSTVEATARASQAAPDPEPDPDVAPEVSARCATRPPTTAPTSAATSAQSMTRLVRLRCPLSTVAPADETGPVAGGTDGSMGGGVDMAAAPRSVGRACEGAIRPVGRACEGAIRPVGRACEGAIRPVDRACEGRPQRIDGVRIIAAPAEPGRPHMAAATEVGGRGGDINARPSAQGDLPPARTLFLADHRHIGFPSSAQDVDDRVEFLLSQSNGVVPGHARMDEPASAHRRAVQFGPAEHGGQHRQPLERMAVTDRSEDRHRVGAAVHQFRGEPVGVGCHVPEERGVGGQPGIQRSSSIGRHRFAELFQQQMHQDDRGLGRWVDDVVGAEASVGRVVVDGQRGNRPDQVTERSEPFHRRDVHGDQQIEVVRYPGGRLDQVLTREVPQRLGHCARAGEGHDHLLPAAFQGEPEGQRAAQRIRIRIHMGEQHHRTRRGEQAGRRPQVDRSRPGAGGPGGRSPLGDSHGPG